MARNPETVNGGSGPPPDGGGDSPTRAMSLSVVIPVYNSEATIFELVETILESLGGAFRELEIVLVNDGSGDRSHERILEAIRRHPGKIRYYRLARNFGEHNAVMCGLRMSTKEAAVIIDDDFQNPPGEIVKLCGKLAEGYDVVYSYYEKKQHHFLRNLGSRFNDAVASMALNKPRDLYLSSFKAMNRFLIDEIARYEGPYPYIDALVLQSTASIGRQKCEHAARREGRSNYTARRLVRLWLNMLTGYSLLPLRLATMLGFVNSIVGLAMAMFFVLSWALGGIFIKRPVPPGWASTIVSVTLLSGIQLLVLGIIGEYLGRLFVTQNNSPQVVIRERIEPTDEAS